ncbi:MAG: 50S ribosomal protein L21e [Methanobacteriota archaeon]|nr:MAG: 50S ribosomal protein L21e [Euryarchaeota archaeon]
MAKASKGGRRRTRNVMQKRARERGLSTITRAFQKFDVGETASVSLDPSIHKGQPHMRFHGRTGVVVGTQGEAYMLELRDGGKSKRIIVRPEHLRKAA